MESEDEDELLQELQQYPNYFQMGTKKYKSFWRKIAKKIEDEKDDLLEFSDLVRIKNQNLEACASYYLGNVDKAEQIIAKVLEETNSTNINACAMMAKMKYRKNEITKAKRHLSHIKELAADPYNIDVAKSELAYAYTRLDARFYKKAIAAYTEAVERNPNIFSWKYGLAAIYRRCMTASIQAMFPDLEIKTCFNEAQKYLTYVLENCTDEKDCFFKARSYIELADLYSTANATDIIFTDKKRIIHNVNQGVQCLPKNTIILKQAGRILRHCSKYAEAEELLQKAYDICPNSYICHHLGLIKKSNIIYQHKKQIYGANKSPSTSTSTSAPLKKWTTPQVKEPYPNEPINVLTKSSDNPCKTTATGGSTFLPNESKTETELAESLSKVSLTDTAESGKEPVKVNESSTPPPLSSWQTSTIEKSGLRINHKDKMTRLINSPNATYDFELSRKLDPCLDLFRQSAELGQEENLFVYYDWGITLLQMIPTKFKEVMEKFNQILIKDHSQFLRYRCYEQYGICKLRMSEIEDLDEISREDYQKDAMEMFRRAIQCWAYCQNLNLSKHFDDAEGNCHSLISIREIILGDEDHGTNPKKDMAKLYYLVKQYRSSLSLYQEVHDELQRTSDTAMDSDVIKSIIRNHLQLKQHTGVLDLLALLLCSKERLKCLEFKTDVLTQMMDYSIDTNDYHLSESVLEFEKDPNEEVDNDVAIIFNEEDQVSKTKGATLQKWLHAFSNSGLKVIKSTETAANLSPLQQIKIICNSKMAIFILANETPSTELTYLMNTALEAQLDNNYFLTKIFPIVINDGMVPDIFKIFRSMKITHQPNILDEQEKSEFLKTFSDVFLE